MPYSDRARYEHEELRQPSGAIVRIRTKRVGKNGTEIRIGYTRTGQSEALSVLRPKGGSHAEPHSKGHHGGPCDAACRRGLKVHRHRRGAR